MFLDSSCNQKLFFKCESVYFDINLKLFEKMHLIKADTGNRKDANCLFIPLEAIDFFMINGKINEFDPSDLDDQLRNINTESLTNSGFIVPCRHLDQTYFYEKDVLIEWLNVNQEVANQIFWCQSYIESIIYS